MQKKHAADDPLARIKEVVHRTMLFMKSFIIFIWWRLKSKAELPLRFDYFCTEIIEAKIRQQLLCSFASLLLLLWLSIVCIFTGLQLW